MSKIAWIGLGVMGFPMAGHIRTKGGYDLTVYNRTAAKARGMGGQIRRPDGGNARRGGPRRGFRLLLRRQ